MRIVPFVSLCAMVGVLTRIGLDELFGPNVLGVTSTESAIFPDWFPNAWGSFVMGFFVPMRQSPFFARHSWLYVGLTTGYCGCTTTFSSWNQDAAAFVVSSADVVTYLLILFEGITAPLVGFIMGRHANEFLMLVIAKAKTWTKRRRKEGTSRALEAGGGGGPSSTRKGNPAVVAGEVEVHDVAEASGEESTKGKERMDDEEGTEPPENPPAGDEEHMRQQQEKRPAATHWKVTRADLLYCLLLSSSVALLCLLWLLLEEYGGVTKRYIWIACLFAPCGAMLRYVLSRYNAWRRCVRFPFFTFLVNIVGSIALALVVISVDLRGYDIDHDLPGYTLHGFQVGFLGSLTTVSTFIGELYALPSVPYAYIYAVASLGTAQAALTLINGLHQWTA